MSAYPHIIAAPNEHKIPFPVHVSLSKVQFCKEYNSRLLAASGWDGTVHLYMLGNNGHSDEKRYYYHGKPVLACTFTGGTRIASGGLDQIVKLVDIETGREINMGGHSNAIRCMEYNEKGQVIVTGSWDSTVKLWDARATTPGGPLQSVGVGDRVYAMDVLGDKIVVGTRDRKIHLFDMRNLATPEQVRDSPLKYQTRAAAFFPTGDAFVVSSIEGRVAIEYVDPSPEEQKKKYAFKCHRSKEDGVECIYPVNALAFHPLNGTFATGGSDAMVNLWDPFNRKRLVQLHR
ncbi:nucleoporin GLE2 family protein [Oesophagostomum dentatum]|uniref:Nucleoporin GLE2 family protein n=1 Tax=Oesophagostomum dentatum TaxID=61180 RepID=A0A0B1SGZ1_OESDE|nr:nucleoporin GLE2 family protein [Oesophagostomum dentatum]